MQWSFDEADEDAAGKGAERAAEATECHGDIAISAKDAPTSG